ncbi:uncharacterized protein LOC126267624 [Schistocerca gregaria]|uniref:uncharacterized protein LOC126267624 n=1 Tax=Schistocerca gregaria TaxID=7010 RepID=UPI00211F259A|nr:uncharacterized protein LOC126267624 [Schistocerca gregaria]
MTWPARPRPAAAPASKPASVCKRGGGGGWAGRSLRRENWPAPTYWATVPPCLVLFSAAADIWLAVQPLSVKARRTRASSGNIHRQETRAGSPPVNYGCVASALRGPPAFAAPRRVWAWAWAFRGSALGWACAAAAAAAAAAAVNRVPAARPAGASAGAAAVAAEITRDGGS